MFSIVLMLTMLQRMQFVLVAYLRFADLLVEGARARHDVVLTPHAALTTYRNPARQVGAPRGRAFDTVVYKE